jgi:hypothetical protein
VTYDSAARLGETPFQSIDKAVHDHPHSLGRNGEYLFAFALVRGDGCPRVTVSAFPGGSSQPGALQALTGDGSSSCAFVNQDTRPPDERLAPDWRRWDVEPRLEDHALCLVIHEAEEESEKYTDICPQLRPLVWYPLAFRR